MSQQKDGLKVRYGHVILAITLASACRTSTEPEGAVPIPAAAPLKTETDSEPSLAPWDASTLIAVILTRDSLLNVLWRPSRLLVESSRGFRDTVDLRPPACVLPSGTGEAFPYSFDWLVCDQISFNTTVVLSARRFHDIARLVSGDTLLSRVLKSAPIPYYPGAVATYLVGVPIGIDATNEALRRIRSQPEVNLAERPVSQPPCITEMASRCPPWSVNALLHFSFAPVPVAGAIPVEPGGWIRITYAEPDGSLRVKQYSFPP